MTIDINSSSVFLDPKTVARFAREWDGAKGEKNMRARKNSRGEDIIEISQNDASSNEVLNEMLLQNGEIILQNEMDQDLIGEK